MELIPKKEKYLIAFNKFKKIAFFGACKLEINKTDKCLIFRTNSTEKKYEEFASTFNRIFVQKENALCIIDETSNKDFLVIFPSKETCSQVIDVINAVKFPSGPPQIDPATDDYLFKNNFYIPILKEIQVKITDFMEIKTVLLDLVNQFEPNQRQTYMNMVFEILLSSTNDSKKNSAINESSIQRNETAKSNSMKNVDLFDDNFNSGAEQSINETAVGSGYSSRKRPGINYSSNNFFSSNPSIHESDFASTTIKKSRKSSANVNDQILNTSHSSGETVTASYEFVECIRKGAIRKGILIFTSDEKDECYEFYYSVSTGGWHACKNCDKMNQKTQMKIISVENRKMKFKFGKNQHICEPIKYSPKDYKIKELPSLDNLKLSRKRETSVTSKNNKKIIKSLDFQLLQRENSGKICTRLIIFDPNDRTLCYEFAEFKTALNEYRCYECRLCFLHYVHAKIIKNEDGEDYVELESTEHLCKPKTFNHGELVSSATTSKPSSLIQKPNFQIEMIPNKIKNGENNDDLKFPSKNKRPIKSTKIKKIIKSPNFQLLQRVFSGKLYPRLIIFDSSNRKLCYEYGYHTVANRYRCCHSNAAKYNCQAWAKLIKDEESDECVELGPVEHLCEPKIFDHEKGEIVLTTKEMPKLRRIEKIYFKIEMIPHTIQREKSTKILTICDPVYRNHEFEYYFHSTSNSFYCKNCMSNGKYVSAKLVENENGEECIQVSEVNHVCL